MVVGIAPPGFTLPGAPPADLWTPLRLDPATATRNNFFLQGLARLQPGVSIEQAEARLDAMMEEIGAQFPENRGVTISLVPLLEQLVTPVRSGLYILLGVVVFVLLIACANIANLLLGRGAARARELAIRSAMGAGRKRLVRQLLTESLMLSLVGAALGLVLAGWGTQALLSRVPAGAAPRLDNVGIDATVLGFTVVISIVAGLVFGLAPVLQSYRHDVNDTLKEGGRGREAGGGTRLRSALAAGQVALALGLLIASGLATRSFVSLMNVDPGFDPEGVTTAFVAMPPSSYAGAPELVTFLDSLVERIAARPGVESVAAISVLPLAGSDSDTGFDIEGRPEPDAPGSRPIVWFRRVTPAYFSTMKQPVLRGREFTEADRGDAPPVVLISDVAAERFWPGEDALGKRVRFGAGNPWHEIVGITQGVRHTGLSQAPRPELYFPYAQRPGRTMTLVVKSAADESAVTDMLRADLAEVDPNLPLSTVATMTSLLRASVAQQRFFMNITGAFGLLALALAAVGIYGVMSYTVSRRTTEMGLRMALGASRGEVLSMIVGQGIRLTVAGIALGLLLAYWATSFMSTVLFDVNPRDLLIFASAPIVLALIALAACLAPALRATRIDPIKALRVD
jgi:putative ABC transport system permease protein